MLKQISHLIIIILLSTLQGACGGGGGGGGGGITDTSAPTVSSTSPENLAFDVDRNSTLTATFDEDIFAITVDAASFSLETSEANIVSGTVSFDGATNIASFSPDNELAMLTDYTATLSTVITDLSGNALAENYSWSFTTADGAWNKAELIEANIGNAFGPQIAVDNNGNALMVWQQNGDIWAKYSDGANWVSSELIETNMATAFEPRTAFDNNGNAFAVWPQYDDRLIGSRISIWVNRFDGSSWGNAVRIETNNAEDAVQPQIVFSSSGKAFVVWQQDDGIRYNIWANRFDGTSWGDAELIEANTDYTFGPQIAVNSSGKAFAVWHQFADSSAKINIWANRFDGISWGSAEQINSNGGGTYRPQITVDNNGNAIAVWQQFGVNSTNNIWVNRFDGTNWGSAERINSNGGDAYRPQITVDNNGNAIAVWEQDSDAWANRFDGTGWGGAERIGDSGGYNLQIAIDNSGKALAVWMQTDGTRLSSIWANRFDGTSWGSEVPIETKNTESSMYPQIDIDSNGKALAVWRQSGVSRSIWGNRFE